MAIEKKKMQEKYTKSQLLQAKTLHYNVDLLQVLLDDDTQYTIADVDKKVQEFTKREVR